MAMTNEEPELTPNGVAYLVNPNMAKDVFPVVQCLDITTINASAGDRFRLTVWYV